MPNLSQPPLNTLQEHGKCEVPVFVICPILPFVLHHNMLWHAGSMEIVLYPFLYQH